MIKYQLSIKNKSVEVSLKTKYPDEKVRIRYSGDRDAIAVVKDWLEDASGLYGHLIGTRTTPVDLDAAMRSDDAAGFSPSLVEGAEVLVGYSLKIPKGAQT